MAIAYFPNFDTQFTDANGLPLSGGKLYAYYDGTSTPAVTYNQNGIANSNPIILDSAGRCDLKGDDSITYTFKLYTASNSLVKTYIGVNIPSGSGGGTVTMDTITQGTSYKKMTTSNVNSLTTGGNTTLHYHSADRQWSNITGKPSTFTPSAHASSHEARGSDPITHNNLTGVNHAGPAETKGHITNGSQTIAGNKTFTGKTEVGFFRSSDNGDTQIYGPSIILAEPDIAVSSANVSASGGTSLMQVSSGSGGASANMSSVGGNEAYVRIQAVGSVSEIRCHSGVSSFSSSGLDSRNVQLGTWDFAEKVYLTLTAKDGNGTVNLETSDDGDTKLIVYKQAAFSGEYLFPEVNEANGTYNIATREWVNSTVGGGSNFTQGVASAVWTITHNKGYYPIVQSWNSTGLVINGTIQHVSINQLTITFATPQSGGARLV